MAVAVGSIAHDERLSTVDHLDELRGRLIVSLVALALAFALCMWQNHALLRIVNAPLAHQTARQARAGEGALGAAFTVQRSTRTVAVELQRVVGTLERPGSGASAATRASLATSGPALAGAVASLSAAPQGAKPVTLGIGEPFTATLGIAFIFALILALPMLLYQAYAFVIPAFGPEQRRATTPLILAAPLLFAGGVLFGYFVVLPAAVRFFQNFNSGQFDVLVQASQYYHFAAVTLLAMGLIFQIPLAILAVTRAGIVTPSTLRHNRRYAMIACGAVAALLPGDAITLLLETVPLYLLFELGVLIASILERRRPPIGV
jgi:sec-independent protein translocase protein TatC